MEAKIVKAVPEKETEELLALLEQRYRKRSFDRDWNDIRLRILADPTKLWSLWQMEKTGGAPEYMGADDISGEYIFFDCSDESPSGRRSICYDDEALESRKEHKPWKSALGMADEMGITIMSEAEYRQIQSFGKYDFKTSSWVKTPASIRKLGGALFGDYRYGQVFIYHNGASSYYAARGFRGSLRI